MNPLQYTSEEMYSSTELIRKSKLLFDKLHKKDIEKAIILRDGKPSFMLLDFSVYEKIMTEYLSLKEFFDKEDNSLNNNQINYVSLDETDTDTKAVENSKIVEEEDIENNSSELDELNEKDLQEALAQIDSLDLGNTKKEGKEPLKEFWE